jgi:hypothetical protein
MELDDFKASLESGEPPPGLGPVLHALWQEAKGDWHAAHRLAQGAGGAEGAWVHAYLHRVEGDLSNADYWYRRAGRPRSSAPTAEEWEEIAAALLGSQEGDRP